MTAAACCWLGLFPLLHFGSYHTITEDKLTLMWILGGITLACFLLDARARRLSFPGWLPLLAGGGLLGWMIVSSLLSPYPATVWWPGSGRHEGLSTQLGYLGLFFLFSFSRVRRGPVLMSAAGGLAVFLAVVLLQRGGGNPFGLYPEEFSFDNASYFQGTIGNVDMCSGYLVIVCGIFLSALVDAVRRLVLPREAEGETRGKAALAACGILAVLAMDAFLLITMDVQSGLLALAVLLVWTPLCFLPKKARIPCLLLVLAAVLVFVWLGLVPSGPAYELHEILHGRVQPSFGSGRVEVWLLSLRMLRADSRLWTGSGADTFSIRFNTYLRGYYAMHPEIKWMDDTYDSPHCEYLALVINFGIPALLFHLVLLLAGCLGPAPWHGSVLGYAVQAALSFSVCLVAPMFWVVLGLSCASGRAGLSQSKKQDPRLEPADPA